MLQQKYKVPRNKSSKGYVKYYKTLWKDIKED